MRRSLAPAVVLGAAAAAVFVAVWPWGSTPLDPPRRDGISARGTVTPRAALFGDSLDARIEVLVDRRLIEPGSLRLAGAFGAYTPSGPLRTIRTDVGRLTRIRYSVELQCLQLKCLPPDPQRNGRRLFRLAPLVLDYKRVDGADGSVEVAWSAVEVASRMSPRDLALLTPIDQPPYRASLALPVVTYSISPRLLVWLLAAGAGLLFSAAGLLVLRFAPGAASAPEPVSKPEPPSADAWEASELERALIVLERARERGVVPDQRKALEHLAGELRRSGERELAGSATALAWAEEPPPSDLTGALAVAVQRRIAEGVNGNSASG
ncbi:MAG: hypothetical protein ABR569_06350 [Gaiellaceae bacterium]